MTRRTMIALLVSMSLVGFAGGVLAQDPEAGTELDPVRIEIPEAGVALAFPGDWSAVVQMVRDEAELPPDLVGSDPVDLWTVVEAAAPDGSGCRLLMYGQHPLGFADHAAWIETAVAGEEGVVSVDTSSATLPVGEAIRVRAVIEDVGAWTAYLLESAQARYRLDCFGVEQPGDDWVSIAETIEEIPAVPLDVPDADDAALRQDVGYVLDFPTVVSVVPADAPEFPLASLMNADCAFALHIVAQDGSAREWLACTLSDEPLQPAEQQGVPPTEVISETGGECVWRSDYWYETDRSQVIASAYGVTVSPDGQVFGWSTYPAEPLDCASS